LQIAESFLHDNSGEVFDLFFVTARQLWFRRNEWIHEGSFTHLNVLILSAQQKIDDYNLLIQKKEGYSSHQVDVRWKPLKAGWLKMNCDAVLDERGRRIGMGVILRDEAGCFRAAWSRSRTDLPDPAAAKASALFLGVSFCKNLGIPNLIIESDSQVIVSVVRVQEASNSRYGHLVDDIRVILRFFSKWKIVHVRRLSNRAAHGLARAALHNVMDCNWDHSTPDCIRDIIVTE
jgi:ribonuclease HI